MEHAPAWIGFLGFVFVMLGLDLGVFHRKAHAIGFREALGWSTIWLAMGLSYLLGLIVAILATGVVASMIYDRRILAHGRHAMAGRSGGATPVFLMLPTNEKTAKR